MEENVGVGMAIDRTTFAIACSPSCTTALLLNIIFIFCLRSPVDGASARQPLRFLLTALLLNSTVQQLVITIAIILNFFTPPPWLEVINVAIIFQTYCSNFSTNAWISIFYYIKIVPQHGAAFVWLKKNIKVAVVGGFIFDQILLLSALSVGVVSYMKPPLSTINLTSISLSGNMGTGAVIQNQSLYILSTKLVFLYFIFPFCTLLSSWGRTFVYLRKHIMQMKQNTSSKSSPHQQNQMRVTVMGIVQTALFIPSSLWTMVMALLFGSPLGEKMDYNKHITMTISSITGLANIVCLGFSQSVFRLSVMAMLKKVKNAFG